MESRVCTARRAKRKLWYTMSVVLVLPAMAAVPAIAQLANHWETILYVPQGGVISAPVGVFPWAHDGWDGDSPLPVRPNDVGVQILLYREHGPNWGGETGFYGGDFEQTPIPAGGSRTWWDFYLWSQNYTPSPPNQVVVKNSYETSSVRPHDGYVGHLVIDQVPAGLTWTGPMDYWFDMTVRYNEFTLPIATVTDPLQGVRMHITVYAPIPEPSALCALAFGLAGLAAVRRRRR